ncbi:hypothetical protein O0L34_g18642 [Tuta absoluta]|nr:hypothetical protein O0L34_g18642 [Tuta absoluta]
MSLDRLSSPHETATNVPEERDRLKNAANRAKRSRDDVNNDALETLMEIRMGELKTLLKTGLQEQADNFTSLKDSMSGLSEQISGHSSKLTIMNSSIAEIRNDLDSVRSQYDKVDQFLAGIKNTHVRLTEEFKGLSNSVEFVSSQQKDFEDRLKKVETAAVIPEKAEAELVSLRIQLSDLKYELQQQQQWERILNLEISGIPEMRNENLPDLVKKIAHYAGVELSLDDIGHVTRVQPRVKQPGRPKSIVAKLKKRIHKDNILAGLRKKEPTTLDIGMSTESKRFYVSEHMTVDNKILYKKCRAAAKANGYEFTWIKNCRIFVRKNETSPHILIRHETDINKIR